MKGVKAARGWGCGGDNVQKDGASAYRGGRKRRRKVSAGKVGKEFRLYPEDSGMTRFDFCLGRIIMEGGKGVGLNV